MTHEEAHQRRLALIYRPFLITRFGTSYPHGGTAVADTFREHKRESINDSEILEWATRSSPAVSSPGSGDGAGNGGGISFETRARYTGLNRIMLSHRRK